MNEIILEALKLGVWRKFDVQFAHMLVGPYQHSLVLVILTLNFYINKGHVCLPLEMVTPKKLFCGSHIIFATKLCEKFGDLSVDHWEELLFSSTVVSNGSFLAPLVLDKKRLYLYRMWRDECLVANFFDISSKQLLDVSDRKTNQIINLLNRFFPITNIFNDIRCSSEEYIDWQKIAVAMVLIRKIVIISGGPGTGKTSIVAKLLSIILLLHPDSSLIIRIAAPTGKSVARLNESIHSIMEELLAINGNYKSDYLLSLRAVTLHRLLGLYSYNKKNKNRAQYNFSFLDYLIIDECSMIDLSMISQIIQSLPFNAKIIFLGDHKQLPSVEPGSVFSDICHFIGNGYTFAFSQQIKKITNFIVPINKNTVSNISDSLCLLKKNYRFSFTSGIGKLAHAISLRNRDDVLFLLKSQNYNDLNYIVLKNSEDYLNMIVYCASIYSDYFKNITYNCNNYLDLEFILNIFHQRRIVSALREGTFGVSRLNFLIEKVLSHNKLIFLEENNQNYVGRPIVITSNAPSLSLFNGEVGIVLSDVNNNIDTSRLYAYFLSSEKKIRKIPLNKLPRHETSFVMTVHQSQGSEFEYVVLVFPEKIMPILTNELFYTGVTRARKHLSIYANDQIVSYAVGNLCKRYSGLIDRLKKSTV